MVGYSYNEYRLIVPQDQVITVGDLLRTSDNDRQSAPARADGTDLRVGSFNVLNYFTSHSSVGGALNVLCKDQADADSAKGCNRGPRTWRISRNSAPRSSMPSPRWMPTCSA